jgi:NAD(P)-dependent dehydrogenase (short-subunit alcohol dehydrogenase family)
MLLTDKTAIVYGAGGKIGSTVARAFAREGARVFLAGRTLPKVQRVGEEIVAAGGKAEAAEVDALDKFAIEQHLDAVIARAGVVDITFNAISIRGDLQGTPLVEMSLENFTTPVTTGISTHFLTATAAARRMIKRGSGVILTLSTSAAGLSGRDQMYHSIGGFGVACSAIESLSRTLAGQLGPKGIRVVCLRPDAIPETWSPPAEADRLEQHHANKIYMEQSTVLGRLPKLREVADAAAFMASDGASAMTGTIVNLTCGSVMDSD